MTKGIPSVLLRKASNIWAAKLFPFGFDIADTAPNTELELKSLSPSGRMKIWPGDYSHTILGDSESWWSFRAWHDWIHARFDCPFTLEGEYKACLIQTGQLWRTFGRGEDAIEAAALLWAEIVSPLEYKADHNGEAPPLRIREFVEINAKVWRPFVESLLEQLGETDWDAIQLAERFTELRENSGGARYVLN